MRGLWKPGGMERGGNTKTHGIVRGEFIIHDQLPEPVPARHLRPAADLQSLGPLLRARSLYHARHRRCRFHEHQHQAHGRAGPQTDGGGEIDPRHVCRFASHFCHPRREGERPAPGREPEERADLLLPELPSLAHPRPHHAVALDQDPEQPLRGALLQLRSLFVRRRPGDAVFGLAKVEPTHSHPAPALAPAGRLPARRHGRRPGRG